MKQRQKRIERFLKKYNKLATFIGATIVLATFIVKEGWRENLKTLGETIDSAQNMYTLRADNQAMISELNGLGSEIEAIRGKITGTELGFTALGVNRTLLLYSWQLQQLQTSVSNVSGLLLRLPDGQKRKAEVDNLSDSVQELRKLHRSIGEMTARAAPRLTPDGSYPADDAKAMSVQIGLLGASMLDAYRRVNELTRETLADAEASRAQQERLYGIATWFSYFLYAFGWLFALGGRLYGVEGMSAAD